MIDDQGQFVYGPTAVYVAPTPDEPGRRARSWRPPTCCITEGRYRSRRRPRRPTRSPPSTQAQVPFDQKGP